MRRRYGRRGSPFELEEITVPVVTTRRLSTSVVVGEDVLGRPVEDIEVITVESVDGVDRIRVERESVRLDRGPRTIAEVTADLTRLAGDLEDVRIDFGTDGAQIVVSVIGHRPITADEAAAVAELRARSHG